MPMSQIQVRPCIQIKLFNTLMVPTNSQTLNVVKEQAGTDNRYAVAVRLTAIEGRLTIPAQWNQQDINQYVSLPEKICIRYRNNASLSDFVQANLVDADNRYEPAAYDFA